MDSIETFHNKKAVVAETVGLSFEADLFKSVPIIIGFCCNGQHWDVTLKPNGCCRNRWFPIRSRLLQIGTDDLRFWQSWTTLRRLVVRKMVVAETVGFWFEADLFKSVLIIIGLACHARHWNVSPEKHGCCRNRWLQIRSRLYQISTDVPKIWLSWTTLRRFTIRNGCCRNGWFQVRSRPLQISTDHPRR